MDVAAPRGAGDLALRRHFEALHNASIANALGWAEVNYVSHVAATMEPDTVPKRGPYVAECRLKEAAPGVVAAHRIGSRRLLSIGLLAAVAVARLVAQPGIVLRMQGDYVTATAEERGIDLPDGDEIALAPSSAVAVSYAGFGNLANARLLERL